MLPPHLIDALYTANQADARRRDLELERARRATPPRPELRHLDRQPTDARGTHRARFQWLRSLVSRPHTAPTSPGDA